MKTLPLPICKKIRLTGSYPVRIVGMEGTMKSNQWIEAIEREDAVFFQNTSCLKHCLLEKCPLGFTAKELVLLLGKRSLYPLFGINFPKYFWLLEAQDDGPKKVSLEQLEQFFSFSYAQTIRFLTYKQLKKAVSLSPWSYSKSFFFSEERELGKKLLEQVYFSSSLPFSVRFIDQLMGFGLYAEQDFEQNFFIGAYTGAFIPLKEAENTAYCFRYPVRWTSLYSYCIDSEKTGNLMRFINHSDRPNLVARPIVINNILHMALFTLHPIAKGEELFLHYGSDYWRKRMCISHIGEKKL